LYEDLSSPTANPDCSPFGRLPAVTEYARILPTGLECRKIDSVGAKFMGLKIP